MDLEETEGWNDCAGEGQKQFMLPTEVSYLRVDICWPVISCEIVASLQRRKHEQKSLHGCESLRSNAWWRDRSFNVYSSDLQSV
jgi:hypothetical protein